MAVVFKGSPVHMAIIGDGRMICVLSGKRCKVPYLVWEMRDGGKR
jgi:hypothetical protein